MTFEQIGYFLALAEERSFVRAARRSGISQPSLTNAIKALEKALGASLFVRTVTGSELTAFGNQMHPLLAQLYQDRLRALDLARIPRPTRLRVDGRVLTARMAAVLLEHSGGPRPIHALVMELRVLRSLSESGLVRFSRANRPTHSIATARGREVIVALLARQADVGAVVASATPAP